MVTSRFSAAAETAAPVTSTPDVVSMLVSLSVAMDARLLRWCPEREVWREDPVVQDVWVTRWPVVPERCH